MPKKPPAKPSGSLEISTHTLDEIEIEDERSFRHVGIYTDLKEALRTSGYRFSVLPPAMAGRWDRALLLNLTFWGAGTVGQGGAASGTDRGGDVLVDRHIPADVVAHVAWHHLAAKALHPNGSPSADALFMGEAIASAFDVYLVGRLLGHAKDSSFLETQVPAMSDAADAAGLSEDELEALFSEIAADPERAFEDLRQLLFDATRALVRCADANEAVEALARFDDHRFAPLLHRYELSNWVLYARAYVKDPVASDPAVMALDTALRGAKVSIDHLASEWLTQAR